MADYKVSLGAILDANASGELQKSIDAIKDLKVKISKAELSPDAINHIKTQLTQNGIDLKLVFGNTAQITNQAKQVGQQVGQQINSGIQNAIQKGNFQKAFGFSGNGNNVAKVAQQYFRGISDGIVTVQERMREFEGNSTLQGFTVNLRNAKGEVESLRYSLRNIVDEATGLVTGQEFRYTSGTTNDAGAIRQIQAIERAYSEYSAKIAQFKATNQGLLSGLVSPLKEFDDALAGLRNGTSSIDAVKSAFSALNVEASNISGNLTGQLNKVDAAVRNIAKGDDTLNALRADLKGLSGAPKELNTELNKSASLLREVKQIEATDGRTADWSAKYREWAESVDSVTSKIRLLQKEQAKASTSNIFNISDLKANNIPYMTKAYNTVEKQMERINSMAKNMGWQDVKVKGIEDATGKIKQLQLTVTEADGAVKSFNMQREKLQGSGKAQYGFVQAGDVKIIKTATQAQEELARATEKANEAQTRKNERATKLQTNIGTEKKSLQAYTAELKEMGLLTGDTKQKIQDMFHSLSKVDSQSGLSTWRSELKGIKIDIGEVVTAYKEQLSVREQAGKISTNIGTGSYEAQVDSLVAKTQKWTDANGNARISTSNLQSALNNLNTAYANITATGGNTEANQRVLIEAEKQLGIQIQDVTNKVTTMNARFATDQSVQSLLQKYQQFYDKNSAAHRRWGAQIKAGITELSSGMPVTIQRANQLEMELNQVGNAARQAGKLGKSWFDTMKSGMKSFSYWTSSTYLVIKTVQEVRQAVTSVRELDTALVDLTKTTTMTKSQLEQFYYTANDTAKQMGVTTKEIIDQAAAWSRLGYSSAEAATKMAKYSSMFASISPGMDVDKATDGLVSIMKAFDIGNDNPDEVLDGIMSKINIIGNTAATSNDEIVTMLSKSSSAMREANNTLEETIALETAAVEITRDDDSVGTAFKTVAMRIRGYDEETESFTNNVEQLSGEIASLTKTASTPGGISLFTDASKTEYKSTYQLLKEISEIYDQLDDKTQAGLLEALAGKRQGQIIAATINNFEAAEKAMDDMANSAGSAEREMAVIMDSVDYKANKLKETGTGIAQNLFKRDDMKNVIDTLTWFGEKLDWVTEKAGLFGTLAIGGGLFAGIKNIGICV